MATLLAIVAVIAAVDSMIFAGWQIRISRVTAELQFETAVITRLDDLLFMVAEIRPLVAACGSSMQKRIAHKLRRKRLPTCWEPRSSPSVDCLASRKNQDSWCSYTKYMLERSLGVLEEILAHQDWWPQLTPFAKDVERRQAA